MLDAQTDLPLHIFLLKEHILVSEEVVETEGESPTQQGWRRIHVYEATEQAYQPERQATSQHILKQYLYSQPKASMPSDLPATDQDVVPLPTSHQLELVLEKRQADQLCYVFNCCREHLIHSNRRFHHVAI